MFRPLLRHHPPSFLPTRSFSHPFSTLQTPTPSLSLPPPKFRGSPLQTLITTLPGLESSLSNELSAILPKLYPPAGSFPSNLLKNSSGISNNRYNTIEETPYVKQIKGGLLITKKLTAREIIMMNVRLKTATRVLIRLEKWRDITSFGALEKRVLKSEGKWWGSNTEFGIIAGKTKEDDVSEKYSFRVSARKSKLIHSKAIESRFRKAIGVERKWKDGDVEESLDAVLNGRSSDDDNEDDFDDDEDEDDFDDLDKDEEDDEEESNPKQPMKETQLILISNHHDTITTSLDTSGQPLHIRGYRQAIGKAPLRETIARALVLNSSWLPSKSKNKFSSSTVTTGLDKDGSMQVPFLLDPMCGSGTIAIEAALLLQERGIAFLKSSSSDENESDTGIDGIRGGHGFQFMKWPGFDNGVMASILGTNGGSEKSKDDNDSTANMKGTRSERKSLKERNERLQAQAKAQEKLIKKHASSTIDSSPSIVAAQIGIRIFAYDRDSGVIQSARENAQRAGVAHLIHFETRPLSKLLDDSISIFKSVDSGRYSNLQGGEGIHSIITNPPWGGRISPIGNSELTKTSKDLRNLYSSFGKIMREQTLAKWGLTVLTERRDMADQIRVDLGRCLFEVDIGGRKVGVYRNSQAGGGGSGGDGGSRKRSDGKGRDDDNNNAKVRNVRGVVRDVGDKWAFKRENRIRGPVVERGGGGGGGDWGGKEVARSASGGGRFGVKRGGGRSRSTGPGRR